MRQLFGADCIGLEVRRLAVMFPDAATIEGALDLASRAPSVQNSQPWQWRVSQRGVGLYADWSRQLGDDETSRRDVLLSCGAVLDHCVTALAAVGWRSRVRRFPDRDDGSNLAFIELVESPVLQANIELAAAIPRRRSDRRRYNTQSIPAGTLELFHIRAARCDVTMGVVPKIRWSRLGDGTVEIRYGASLGDEVTESQAGGGAMLLLGTETDSDPARLRAGEALSQILLAATAAGLASCPLTEPLEDTRARLALACEVFDAEAYPQSLIRLGWAATDSEPLGPVERRSVAETTVWDMRD